MSKHDMISAKPDAAMIWAMPSRPFMHEQLPFRPPKRVCSLSALYMLIPLSALKYDASMSPPARDRAGLPKEQCALKSISSSVLLFLHPCEIQFGSGWASALADLLLMGRTKHFREDLKYNTVSKALNGMQQKYPQSTTKKEPLITCAKLKLKFAQMGGATSIL
eukprot:272133-Amphidinium_carterae.1